MSLALLSKQSPVEDTERHNPCGQPRPKELLETREGGKKGNRPDSFVGGAGGVGEYFLEE